MQRLLEGQPFERIGGSQPIHVDIRVIAATNRDLEASIREGSFREDLFYRLSVFPIAVPPLRALIASGTVRVKLRLPNSHPLSNASGDCATHELAQWLQSEVETTCQAFNERNGNDWDTQVANQWLALA